MSARRLLTALGLALVAPAPAAAQEPGATAAVVLRIEPAPRALALGGAYAALADELSVFYNPARLAAAAPAASLAYRTLPVDAGVGAAAFALRLGPGTLGAGVQYLNYGEVEVFEPDPASGGDLGLPTGERVGGGELAVTAAYAVRVLGRIQLGAAAKLLRLQLAEAAASGAAFDLGLGADLLDGRLMLGAAVRNLGHDVGPVRASPLPRSARAGAALHLTGRAGLHSTLAVEAVGWAGAVAPAAGIEVGLAATRTAKLVGRAGYDGSRRAPSAGGLVAGAGLALDGLTLDYAYQPLGALGATHVFGVALRPGPRD